MRINSAIVIAAKWAFYLLIGPKFCKVAETFCNEVAVLWFVFPLLDTIYEHRNLPGNPISMSDPLLRQGFGVSGLFFLFAVILSHIAGEDH